MRFDVGTFSTTLLCACWAAGIGGLGQAPIPTLSVDVSSGQHSISKEVYGIVSYGLDANYAKEIAVPNIRWGGDGTTRYNWQADSSNAGFDWYFMGGNGTTNPVPGASADLMIRTYAPADALITIPIIPYVNKSAAWSCSFPVSVYGPQQSTNPYVHPNGDTCGNSIASNGTQLVDSNIYANHIDNSTGLQKGWLQHLVGTFGPASQGGVGFYQLDNEPDGWGNTHRDVLPNGADYPTITQLGEQYAAAIKQVDSSAMVLGPSDFTLGGWVGDTTKQNGLLAGQYYLQQMAAYQKQNGVRLLDYFDEHYYFDVSSPAAQLASTRTLWDPSYNGGTWVEQWVFGGPMQLIPRFKGWVSQYYPGTKISLSEYSIDSGSKSIVDALAEMDVLGIFGREQLDFANMWSPPAPTDPIAFAFKMYRNYDGNGGQYGDTWVNAISSDQSQLSVYAAQRSADKIVTILVLNKTTAAISTTLTLAGVTLPSSAAVYRYSGTNLQEIQSSTASIQSDSISYSFPAYSATLFAISPAPTPPTGTTSTLSALPTQATAGQNVVLTATVTGGSPTGLVTLADGGASIGSVSLSGGVGVLTLSTLSAGSHSITAAYSGDRANAASTSNPVTVSVTPPSPASTTTTLTSSSSQLTSNQNLSLTMTVGSASGTPSGTVTVSDNGTILASVQLISGTASFSDSSLTVGSHSLVAAYQGDSTHATSASGALTITVVPATPPPPTIASTTTSLNASATQMTPGQILTLTAMVTASAGTPTGTVTFRDGSNVLGAGPLVNGTASITSTLSAGSHTIVATYAGDPGDGASSSAAVIVMDTALPPLAPQDFQLQLAEPAITLNAGDSGQVGITITPENGFDQQVKLTCSGLPAGATCSFSPLVLTPAATMTSTMIVALAPAPSLARSSILPFLFPVPAALLIMGKKRKGTLIAFLSLTLLIAGCGAGITSAAKSTVSASAAANTYPIQVTAVSAEGQTHTQQIMLVVE